MTHAGDNPKKEAPAAKKTLGPRRWIALGLVVGTLLIAGGAARRAFLYQEVALLGCRFGMSPEEVRAEFVHRDDGVFLVGALDGEPELTFRRRSRERAPQAVRFSFRERALYRMTLVLTGDSAEDGAALGFDPATETRHGSGYLRLVDEEPPRLRWGVDEEALDLPKE
ncbi:MAG: hypothetical protein AAGF12_27820 [Myxococcota bacterium]